MHETDTDDQRVQHGLNDTLGQSGAYPFQFFERAGGSCRKNKTLYQGYICLISCILYANTSFSVRYVNEEQF